MTDTVETDNDVDNDKVLEKLNVLVDKYCHYDPKVIEQEYAEIEDSIPVLTECVTIRSKQSESQFDELSPLRLLLDAALIDAKINLGPADRQALVHALENRIVVQENVVLEQQT